MKKIIFLLFISIQSFGQITFQCPPSISCVPNITAGGGTTGLGAINYVSKFNNYRSLTNTILYDNGASVGANTSTVLGSVFNVVGSSSLVRDGGINGALEIQASTSAASPTLIFSNLSTARTGYLQWSTSVSGNDATKAFSYLYPTVTGGGSTSAFHLALNNNIGVSGNSEIMTWLSNGNVGIGTTAPSANLEVIYSGAANYAFKTNNSQSDFFTYLSSAGTEIGVLTNKPLSLETNGTMRAYISGTTGNMGIGTSSPTEKLNVNGNIDVFGNITNSTGGITINPTGNFVVNPGANIDIDAGAGHVTISDQGGNSATINGNVTLHGEQGDIIFDCNAVNARVDNGNLVVNTVGYGLQIKEGSNATMGIATLSGGTKVVSTTAVTANSRILLTAQSLGTITVPVGLAVSARTAGTSFTILSGNVADTSPIAWIIVEPK